MVRLRAAELLGGGGRSHGGPEAEAAQRQQSVGDRVEEAPASWALQLQGAAALALVVLDRVLQTGVVDRHAIEGKEKRRRVVVDERYRVSTWGLLQLT